MSSDLVTEVDDGARSAAREGERVRLRDANERRWIALPVSLDLVVLAAMWHAWFRPLWHDEVWRAYHVTLTSGFFSSLKSANAPMGAGWLLIERMSTAVFGNVEWALRLPSFASLFVFSIATYRLARWWLTPAWSSLTASLASLNTSLLLYGLQLRPYLVDAACTSLLLCAWLAARARRESAQSTLGPYVLASACALISLPAVLMIGPLVLYDTVHALRRRGALRFLAGPFIAGAIAGAHLLLFVMPQSFLAHNPYWRSVALAGTKSANLHHLRTAVVSFPAGVVTAAFTAPEPDFLRSPLQRPTTFPVHAAIAIGCAVVWTVGTVAMTRRRRGPILLVALGGSWIAAMVAATRTEWPLGFVRVNLFLIPMLYVLGAIGMQHIARAARRRHVVDIAVPLMTVFCLLVGGTGLWRLRQLHEASHRPLSLDGMRALVAEERSMAVPGDLFVVLTRHSDVVQWMKAHLYYATLSDRTRLPFATARDELGLTNPSDDLTSDFLEAHPEPRHVFLVSYNAAHRTEIELELAALRRSGFCPEQQTAFGGETGSLTVLQGCVRNTDGLRGTS